MCVCFLCRKLKKIHHERLNEIKKVILIIQFVYFQPIFFVYLTFSITLLHERLIKLGTYVKKIHLWRMIIFISTEAQIEKKLNLFHRKAHVIGNKILNTRFSKNTNYFIVTICLFIYYFWSFFSIMSFDGVTVCWMYAYCPRLLSRYSQRKTSFSKNLHFFITC